MERGPLESLFASSTRSRRGAPAVVPAARARRRPAASPLPVFENYIKGLLAESPAGQVRFLEAALKLSPRYDPARIALWQVYTAQGEHARAPPPPSACPRTSPLSRRARFLAALSRIPT